MKTIDKFSVGQRPSTSIAVDTPSADLRITGVSRYDPGESNAYAWARNICVALAAISLLAVLGVGALPIARGSGPDLGAFGGIGGAVRDDVAERKVTSAAELNDVLSSDFTGRVIVPRDVNWELRDSQGQPLRKISIHSGVHLMGERGDLASRPTLYTLDKSAGPIFEITGNDVRVEGLHLIGPKVPADSTHIEPYVLAISVREDAEVNLGRRVVIADNEFEHWNGAAVRLIGGHDNTPLKEWDPVWKHLEPSDAALVHVERNYMHHNVMNNGGYGVDVNGGAYGTIEGNVFDFNRHAVTATGRAYSGYVARFNYVLQGGYEEGGGIFWGFYNQHFDVHGEGDGGYGLQAGIYFEIAFNAIRGEQGYKCVFYCFKHRPAFMLRGIPQQGAFFHDNVLVHDDLDTAVSLKWDKGDAGIGEDHNKFHFHASGNQFDTDYTREIASGDFDGDGRTDVFMATGTAWFFSRAGIRPWELLHESSKRMEDLGFADIDNDRVTDILYRDSTGNLGYLRGGRGALIPLTSTPVLIKDLRFGDFDGDELTDIFYTYGGQWQVWYGGRRAWIPVQTSAKPILELLFGEFDDVKGTDVAGVSDSGWVFSSAATQGWTQLNGKLSVSFANAVAADFDNNGKTDIAWSDGNTWRYSRDGHAPLADLRHGKENLTQLLIGQFVPINGSQHITQVLGFDSAGLRFIVWRGLGTGDPFVELSKQNMR